MISPTSSSVNRRSPGSAAAASTRCYRASVEQSQEPAAGLPAVLVAHEHRLRIHRQRLFRGGGRVVFVIEVLPAPVQARVEGAVGDGGVGPVLGAERALSIHLDEHGQLGGRDEGFAFGDHRKLELVDHEQLLGQFLLPDDRCQPLGHGVHLGGGDTSDLAEVHLIGFEAPLRVECQPDVWQSQQLLVPLGLGEEVGPAGLEVEYHVHARLPGRLDPRPDVVDRQLRRVVVVLARSGRGDGGDQVEGRARRPLRLRSRTRLRVASPARSPPPRSVRPTPRGWRHRGCRRGRSAGVQGTSPGRHRGVRHRPGRRRVAIRSAAGSDRPVLRFGAPGSGRGRRRRRLGRRRDGRRPSGHRRPTQPQPPWRRPRVAGSRPATAGRPSSKGWRPPDPGRCDSAASRGGAADRPRRQPVPRGGGADRSPR
jgi:hypothetical protein